PSLPVAVVADGLKSVDVFLAILLQVKRHVEKRLSQDLLLREPEGDEEPAGAPVPVEVGMDRLELSVSDARLEQGRNRVRVVEVPLQVGERVRDELWRRRHEPGRRRR